MRDFFVKLFAPWKAAACFDAEAAFHGFLLGRNRALNAVRVVFFAVTLVCLILAYATDRAYFNYIAAGAMVLALGLTLVIMQNEKQLPQELREP